MEHNETWKLWVLGGILAIAALIGYLQSQKPAEQEWIATVTDNGDVVTNPDRCHVREAKVLGEAGPYYEITCDKH